MDAAEKITAITRGRPNTFYLDFNAHWNFGDTVEQAELMECPEDQLDYPYWESAEERDKAIAANSVWKVAYYWPSEHSYVGAKSITMDGALDLLMKRLREAGLEL